MLQLLGVPDKATNKAAEFDFFDFRRSRRLVERVLISDRVCSFLISIFSIVNLWCKTSKKLDKSLMNIKLFTNLKMYKLRYDLSLFSYNSILAKCFTEPPQIQSGDSNINKNNTSPQANKPSPPQQTSSQSPESIIPTRRSVQLHNAIRSQQFGDNRKRARLLHGRRRRKRVEREKEEGGGKRE